MKAFDCKMCGRCCEGVGGIVLAKHDLERIAKHLGLEIAEFCARYTEKRNKKIVIKAGEDGFCVFFKGKQGCGVHQGRPDICRAWPFFKGNLSDHVSLEMASADCPGINRAASFEEFRRQGLEYLRENGLIAEGDDASAPNALKL